MEPTLLVLAAGMGARYGGLKQLERLGPSGETIMDYSVHDALTAGFTKVVFVIRRAFEAEFRSKVGSRYGSRVAVEYVFQELDQLPVGFVPHPTRQKPWGTVHALWCARECVRGPFCCVNADDYYGKRAFRIVFEHLMRPRSSGQLPEYCIVGYPILKTLSEHGAVTRAICELDEKGLLMDLTERRGVAQAEGGLRYLDATGTACHLEGTEAVSMNMMGFTPAVFGQLESELALFLEAQQRVPDESECVIPTVVGSLVRREVARVRVLPTSDTWFGVTHPADKPRVIEMIRRMVEKGEYPSPIWRQG